MSITCQIREIKKSFGKVHALRGVSMEFKSGQIIGLAGHNGCGKTTLIRTILGLVSPDSGEILIEGKNIIQEYLYRNRIGYMPQNADYPGNLSIQEIFTLLEDCRSSNAIRKSELIERFQISKILHRKTAGLSGGTKQRIAAVIAFMFDPEFIILDEPTAGLDPVSANILKELIVEESNKNKCILLVSHIMSEIEQIVTHLNFLNEGKLQISGNVPDILRSTNAKTLEDAVVRLMKASSNA